ncbi:MAG: carboxypeptidase-like regulatory domain-containing protein, partial [Bacteroidota bacterium]
MRKIILLIVCFLFSMKIYCQVINGSIKDKINGEPLIGATVLIKGTTIGASADINGNFTLNLNRPLPVTLVCTYVGYVNQEQVVNTEGKNVIFQMVTVRTNLKEISITDQRLSEKQREAPLTVEAMDIIAIKETPAANFYEGLGQLKGVDLTSASIGFKVINTRGFNSTSPVRSLQIIDGVDNQSPGLNFSLGNFLGCSEMDVLKVELVAGASSAFYGPNAFNGVISMQTRSPFIKPGFEISAKTGTRDLIETSMRYAVVFKNKDGVDKLGFKFNAFFMKAKDWEANNPAATPQSKSDINNPGRYDAVNIYGDEYNGINDATARPAGAPGLGIYYRKGYAEKDLVDYNTQNIKLSGAVHYRVRPENEIIYSSSLGYGTTVYQGDNRYSLKDIRFYQNKIEYRKKDKFFIRFYETHEDAGKSYDAYFTALLLQRAAKKDEVWNTDYLLYYNQFIRPKVMNMPGYLPAYQGYGQNYIDSLQNFLNTIS